MKVLIQTEAFDLNAEIAQLSQDNPKVGAIATFLGLVRDVNDGVGIQTLTLEHYPGMTEKSLEEIVQEAFNRWPLLDVSLIHRVGALEPSDPIVLVAVAASHRREAFTACEFIMDYLKTRAPFWKKENTPEGEHWVDARDSDDSAAARWQGNA